MPFNSKAELRAMFEQSALGMARVALTDARWIDVNNALCKMLGRSRADMLSTSWLAVTHPDDIETDLLLFKRMSSGEVDSYSIEKRFLHTAGHVVWAKLTLNLVRDAKGNPEYELAIVEDISAYKQAEEAFGETEAKYRELFNNMVEEVHFWELVRDEQGCIATWRLKDANPPALKTWGRLLEEIRGKTADEIFGTGASAHYCC